VVAPLYIKAYTKSVVSYLPKDICYQWCLVIMEAVADVAQAGGDATISILAKVKAVAAEAVVTEALALAPTGKGYL
jgi:hypothetical protein